MNSIFRIIGSLFTGGPIGAIVDIAKGWFESSQKLKEAELNAKLQVMKAKTVATVAIFKEGLAGDIAWENTALDNSGWKDEFWTLILATPLILAWIPLTKEWVVDGFATFATMPDWYQVALGIAISVAFGYRKFAEVMALRNGIDVSRLADLQKLSDLIPTDKS